MGSEYICGPVSTANNSEEAISQIQPLHNFAIEVALADSVVCTPRYGVSISLTVGLVLFVMGFFSILGVLVGRHSVRNEQGL